MRETFALLWSFEKKEKVMTKNYYDNIHEPYMLSGQVSMQNTTFNPSRPDPGRREKINLKFYFHTSL